MAMDATQSKAQNIRRVLLPHLDRLAKEAGIHDEVNLICSRMGTLDLTVTGRLRTEMFPLFTAAEIADDSYKTHWLPRVTKLLADVKR